MAAKAIKYGNGVAVVIPKRFVERLGITPGTLVEFLERDGVVSICPVDTVPLIPPRDRQFIDELHKKRRRVFDALGE